METTRRLQALVELQEEIMRERAHAMAGKAFRVLVEGKSIEAPGYWEAGSWRETPEIEGVVFIPDSPCLQPGTWQDVVIKDTEGNDLIGLPEMHGKGERNSKYRG